jgi:molybdopterin/thiamine biosynthesis adenylyltransferase
MSKVFFARAGRVGRKSQAERAPELAPLQAATICVFGLGCLGAPSTMEFARCGVGKLRVIDYDFVDPATIGRWPFGLHAAGLHKAAVLVNAITQDYPFTEVMGFNGPIGAVRDPDKDKDGKSALAFLNEVTEGASLIYDATAEIGVQHFLSDFAAELGVPYVGVDATAGGWGGRVVRVVPGSTAGCWMCFQTATNDGTIPEPPMHPNGEIQPVGCADPTFVGAGFDMVQVALTGVRTAVSTLCAGTTGGYPAADWDVTIVSLRNDDGKLIPPLFQGYRLERHEACSRCNQT